MSKYRTYLLTCCLMFSVTQAVGQILGNASYYSNSLHGHIMSNGERYHRDSLTCAHRNLPFGTLLKVYNPRNQKSVIVEVTDRGPFSRRFIIDLSLAAAQQLDIIRYGYCPVEVTVMLPIVIPFKPQPLEIPQMELLPPRQWTGVSLSLEDEE